MVFKVPFRVQPDAVLHGASLSICHGIQEGRLPCEASLVENWTFAGGVDLVYTGNVVDVLTEPNV